MEFNKWNLNNSIEKMKIYFSITFYDDRILQYKKTVSPPIS